MAQRKLSILYVISFFILPFLPTFIPSSSVLLGSFYLHDLLALGLSLVFGTYILINFNSYQVKINQLPILLFILLLIGQSIFLTSYKSFSYIAIIYLFCASLSASLIYNLQLNNKSLLSSCALALLGSAYLQIIITLLQLNHIQLNVYLPLYNYQLDLTQITPYNILIGDTTRISGSIYQANLYANLLCCALWANLALSTLLKSYHKLLCTLSALLISVFIALSFSRIAFVYALSFLIYAVYLWVRRFNWQAILALLSAIFIIANSLLVGFGAAKWFMPSINNTKQVASDNNNQRLLHTFDTLNLSTQSHTPMASDSQRITLWSQAWLITKQHWLVGCGWNYYINNFFNNQKSATKPATLPQLALPTNNHNLFLYILACTGVIGFIVIAIWCLYVFSRLYLLPIELQILPLGMVLTQLIHSQVEFPLFYAPYLFMLFILVNISDNKVLTTIKLTPCIKIIASGVLLIASWQFYLAFNNFLILAQVKAPNNTTKGNIFAVMSAKYQLGNNPLWDYYSDVDLASKINISAYNKENAAIFDLSYLTLNKIVNFTPYPDLSIKLALLEQIKGNTTKAQQLITTTLKTYPSFYDTLFNFAQQLCADNHTLWQQIQPYFTKAKHEL